MSTPTALSSGGDHKNEIVKWQEAVDLCENRDYAKSMRLFLSIADAGSKIYFNMGMIYATLERDEDAVISFTNATYQDPYFAVAYFQRGVSQWLMNRVKDALESFCDAKKLMRSNSFIDYTQLGLPYKLYAFEVFFNCALCELTLGNTSSAMSHLMDAENAMALDEHKLARYQTQCVLKSAKEKQLDKYSPFSVPDRLMFRPSETKLKNANKKDYLGQAEVILEDQLGFLPNSSSIGIAMKKMTISADPSNRMERRRGNSVDDSKTRSKAEEAVKRVRSHPWNQGSLVPLKHQNKTRLSDKPYRNKELPSLPGSKHPSNSAPVTLGRDTGSDSSSSSSSSSQNQVPMSPIWGTMNSDTPRLKIKCHLENEDACIVMMPLDLVEYDKLLKRVCEKTHRDHKRVRLKFRDEEGTKVLLTDQEDLEVAMSLAQTMSSSPAVVMKLDLFISE